MSEVPANDGDIKPSDRALLAAWQDAQDRCAKPKTIVDHYEEYVLQMERDKNARAESAARRVVDDLQGCFDLFNPRWVQETNKVATLIVGFDYDCSADLSDHESNPAISGIFQEFAAKHGIQFLEICRDNAHFVRQLSWTTVFAKSWKIGTNHRTLHSQLDISESSFRVHVDFTHKKLRVILKARY